MTNFMDKDFILSNETAKKLYHGVAAKLPIIDYHCHIDPKEIAENAVFTNITQLWLYGDHYKWRAMRSCGVEEKYITGDASDFEKFKAFATIMPDLIGNPMYHWSHLELKRYFDCDLLIIDDLGTEVNNQFTASVIYNVLTSRINSKKSTIINTNLSHNELRERYADRITSRLFGEFRPLLFTGRDIRRQKISK